MAFASGLFAAENVTVGGNAKLTALGGGTNGKTFSRSSGIDVTGDFVAKGNATVNAAGSTAVIAAPGTASESIGMNLASGNYTFRDNAKVTATGGSATGSADNAYSYGINVAAAAAYISIQDNAEIINSGDIAEASSTAYSRGINTQKPFSISGGVTIARSGKVSGIITRSTAFRFEPTGGRLVL